MKTYIHFISYDFILIYIRDLIISLKIERNGIFVCFIVLFFLSSLNICLLFTISCNNFHSFSVLFLINTEIKHFYNWDKYLYTEMYITLVCTYVGCVVASHLYIAARSNHRWRGSELMNAWSKVNLLLQII